MNLEQFKRDLRILKSLLIVLTCIQTGYFIALFNDISFWSILVDDYYLIWLIWMSHFGVVAFFIGYIWKKMPTTEGKKIDNTLMIIFLGAIGMWLWMPNNKEIEKFTTVTNSDKP